MQVGLQSWAQEQAQTDTNRTSLDISLFILSASPLSSHLFPGGYWVISSTFLTQEKRRGEMEGEGRQGQPVSKNNQGELLLSRVLKSRQAHLGRKDEERQRANKSANWEETGTVRKKKNQKTPIRKDRSGERGAKRGLQRKKFLPLPTDSTPQVFNCAIHFRAMLPYFLPNVDGGKGHTYVHARMHSCTHTHTLHPGGFCQHREWWPPPLLICEYELVLRWSEAGI